MFLSLCLEGARRWCVKCLLYESSMADHPNTYSGRQTWLTHQQVQLSPPPLSATDTGNALLNPALGIHGRSVLEGGEEGRRGSEGGGWAGCVL